MLLTVYGAFIRELGGAVAVRDLVTLFAELGIEPSALRNGLSRLKKSGTLLAHEVDGRPGYRLSPDADALVDEGVRRLLMHPGLRSLSDGWALAIFSVPESQRQLRARLTARLEWLGYGQLTSGVRIAPAALLEETERTIRRLQLEPFVHLMTAQYRQFQNPHELVAQWWDLQAIARGYEQFIIHAQPVRDRWRSATPSAGEAFVDYVRARTLWRRLPYLDPGLPPELYPRDWPGTTAIPLWLELHQRLFEPAMKHVRATASPS